MLKKVGVILFSALCVCFQANATNQNQNDEVCAAAPKAYESKLTKKVRNDNIYVATRLTLTNDDCGETHDSVDAHSRDTQENNAATTFVATYWK